MLPFKRWGNWRLEIGSHLANEALKWPSWDLNSGLSGYEAHIWSFSHHITEPHITPEA